MQLALPLPWCMVLRGKQNFPPPPQKATLSQGTGKMQLSKAECLHNIHQGDISVQININLISNQPGPRVESSLLDNSSVVFSHTANNFIIHLAYTINSLLMEYVKSRVKLQLGTADKSSTAGTGSFALSCT